MRPISSLIFSFLIILMPGYSSFSQTHAQLIPGKTESVESEAIEQEELFLAPPLPDDKDNWAETTVPEVSTKQNRERPSLKSPPIPSKWKPVKTPPIQSDDLSSCVDSGVESLCSWIDLTTPIQPIKQPTSSSAPSQWLELTPPKDSHWRNKLSFPSKPGSRWNRPTYLPNRRRGGQPSRSKAKGRWEPWVVTPIVEPADRLYIEKSRVKPHAKVRLDDAQLQTILVNKKIHHRIIGQLYNHTPGYIYNLRVYYHIQRGLQTVDVGQFSVTEGQPLAPGDRIRFAYPVPMTGELKISFVEWKYEDGSQGVAERGTL